MIRQNPSPIEVASNVSRLRVSTDAATVNGRNNVPMAPIAATLDPSDTEQTFKVRDGVVEQRIQYIARVSHPFVHTHGLPVNGHGVSELVTSPGRETYDGITEILFRDWNFVVRRCVGKNSAIRT